MFSLDDFETTDPVEVNGKPTGTEVIVSNPLRNFRSLQEESTPLELAKMFAAYLTEYPSLEFNYNRIAVDPKRVQNHGCEYSLGHVEIGDGRKTIVAVSYLKNACQIYPGHYRNA